ncbi:MAG: dienelactone hydrolase family protein [Cyanobacterium sp. T60_A2020_053]|nr:dienelactone hydrolase family protein [Cyanobacterium sp. T60_A2020_053]
MRKFISFTLVSFLIVIALTAFQINHPAPVTATNYSEYMAKAHKNDLPIPTGIIAQAPKMEVKGEMLTYGNIDGQPIMGYVSTPVNAEKPLPGLIVIHEWWGLNDNIKMMTDRLAGEGYTALAVDLYQGDVADNPDEALKLVQRALGNTAPLENNLKQAYKYLSDYQNIMGITEAPRVGSIGWCFGGLWSLNTALLLPDQLDATVIYYGGNITTDPKKLMTLQMPILGIFGELDQNPSVALVKEFEQVLLALGKEVEIHIYEKADHAFANSSGTRYNAEAAESAWEKTTAFLAKYL